MENGYLNCLDGGIMTKTLTTYFSETLELRKLPLENVKILGEILAKDEEWKNVMYLILKLCKEMNEMSKIIIYSCSNVTFTRQLLNSDADQSQEHEQ